jgi:hypothetical protein
MTDATMKKPRYHLRYQIAPGPDVADYAKALADFCVQHSVEEVVLFYAAEEWNDGLMSREQEDRWFDTIRTAREIIVTRGIECSLNPWMTVLHTSRGRSFPADYTFAPTIAPDGEASTACASFADPGWLDYVTAQYGRFAELGFRVLWVEDDFRYHNHTPLTWGGGFEPEMIARFEKKVGQSVSREELVEMILRPGEPHPWRALWMATWRETQLEVAAALAKAVGERAPDREESSRLGLMSSGLEVHSAEGRDWHALFDALTIKGEVVHRPHYSGYSDQVGRTKTNSIVMLETQRTLRPESCEVAPEVENFPFTTWSKADAQTWAEMALSTMFGADALLLDVFPFSGVMPESEPRVGKLLDRARPALAWIGDHFPKGAASGGVSIPWKEDAEAHVRTRVGRSMGELDASIHGAGRFLLESGIPVSACDQPVTAVFGSLAWAFSDAEIEIMLSAGLLLDAESAWILQERGFGHLLGVTVTDIVERESSRYAMEMIVDADSGASPGLRMNANSVDAMGLLDPDEGAREWTSILEAAGQRIGAGVTLFNNRTGGRVVVWATPNPAMLPGNDHRQCVAQSAVRFAAEDKLSHAFVTGGPYLLPMQFETGGVRRMVVMNGSPDPARPVISVPVEWGAPSSATLLSPVAEPVSVEAIAVNGGISIDTDVVYHGFVVFSW